MSNRDNPSRKAIGKVVSAEWNEKSNAIDLEILFPERGWRIQASVPSGYDAKTGTFASRQALKSRVDKMRTMVVYDNSGRMNLQKMTREQLARLTINVSLSGAGISVSARPADPDSNAYLSRILR